MINRVLPAAVALAMCLLPAPAVAQTTPLDGRLVVSINIAGQPGDQSVNWSRSFDRYEEAATVSGAQEIKTGAGLLDIGAAVRISGQFGAGLAFSSFSTERGATVVGSLPHPLVFGQPRSFALTTDGLEHRQRAVHLHAVAFLPFVENVDIMLSAGPTFFSVTQQFLSFDDFSEVGEPFTDVNIIQSIQTQKQNTIGFNIGADATYSITPMIGVGGMLRYTRGSAGFTVGDQPFSIDAGNIQFGAGLRLRF